jgi:hypothetical protein
VIDDVSTIPDEIEAYYKSSEHGGFDMPDLESSEI